jgi:hypothetical protein
MVHRSNFFEKGAAVAFHCAARILLGESQIESATPVRLGKSPGACAEAMHKPGDFLE